MLPEHIRKRLTDQQFQFLEEAVKQVKATKGPGNSAGWASAISVVQALGWPLSVTAQRGIASELERLGFVENVRYTIGTAEFIISPNILACYP